VGERSDRQQRENKQPEKAMTAKLPNLIAFQINDDDVLLFWHA
jgi:hypothetical protein